MTHVIGDAAPFINPDACYVGTAARWIVGVVLLTAGLAKMRSPKEFARAIATHDIVPIQLIRPLSMVLPATELLLGLGLLLGLSTRLAATASTVLFMVFAVVVGLNLARGNPALCGCFGSAQRSPIGSLTMVRSGILLVLSVCALLFANPYLALGSLGHSTPSHSPPPIEGIPLAFLTAVAAVIPVAIDAFAKARKV